MTGLFFVVNFALANAKKGDKLMGKNASARPANGPEGENSHRHGVLIQEFIKKLQVYKPAGDVFNPWRDFAKGLDIGPEAPHIRGEQMKQFLLPRISRARYLLVAEAIGYQGGRFTGVSLTSERILLGHHGVIDPIYLLPITKGRRTSNPNNPNLKRSQRNLGFTEPTATIIWGEIIKNQISPYQVITWNIFPFHPFRATEGPLTNRTPTKSELEVGGHYLRGLLEMCPGITIISIGVHARRTLDQLGIKNSPVPHPANGGAARFKREIKNIFNA